MEVFASDPWYTPADATIDNFEMHVGGARPLLKASAPSCAGVAPYTSWLDQTSDAKHGNACFKPGGPGKGGGDWNCPAGCTKVGRAPWCGEASDTTKACRVGAFGKVQLPFKAVHGDAHRVSANGKMENCWGDCDSDSHCASGLKCFQRNGMTSVPGCNWGGSGDVGSVDYCYDPAWKGKGGAAPQCTDKKAPYTGATCGACPKGFDSTPKVVSGGKVCIDTDACTNNPCHSASKCTDLKPPSTGFSCSKCPNGYSGNGVGSKGCTDANDCTLNGKPGVVGPCGTGATSCTDTGVGSYRCACAKGYASVGSSSKPKCAVVNQCSADEDDCKQGAVGGSETGYTPEIALMSPFCKGPSDNCLAAAPLHPF